ncbi:MAG: hypothetical protein MEQ07_00090 [Aquimonas sp.]|nr:hypothetical protein [Aquimonas sp.]
MTPIRREHAHWLLPALAALAVAVLLLRQLDPAILPLSQHPLVPLWSLFVLTYVGVAAISLMPAPLGNALDRVLSQRLQQSGAGLYGVLALAIFLRLEANSFAEAWANTNMQNLLRSLLQEWLVGFSLDSLMNSIQALVWPGTLISKHGWQSAAVFVLACAAVFELGKRLLPEAHGRMEHEAADAGQQAARHQGGITATAKGSEADSR